MSIFLQLIALVVLVILAFYIILLLKAKETTLLFYLIKCNIGGKIRFKEYLDMYGFYSGFT
jgi:hypothetical protein